MTLLKPIEQAFWQAYLNTLPPAARPANAHVYAGYAGSAEITDKLLALYLARKKTAGSSVAEAFLIAGDPLPAVGDYWIYLDGKSRPALILRCEKVVRNKFRDMPLEIAVAEGEGNLSLEYWKEAHARHWKPYLSEWGLSSIEEATIITEYFRIVHQ